MMLAAELTLAGIDVVVVERRPSFELESPRSRGLHSRTIEVLDQRGIADRFLAEGTAMQVQAFAGVPLDISDFPTRHNYGLALLQSHVERIMSGWIDELGVPILREREVDGLRAGRRWRRRRPVRRHVAAGAATWSVATGAAAWCARPPASSSRAGIRRRAGSRPRSRWRNSRSSACGAVAASARPKDGRVGVTLIEPDVDRTDEPDPRRSPRCARPRRRNRLRGAQPALHLALHRHDPPGGVLPQRARAARR